MIKTYSNILKNKDEIIVLVRLNNDIFIVLINIGEKKIKVERVNNFFDIDKWKR